MKNAPSVERNPRAVRRFVVLGVALASACFAETARAQQQQVFFSVDYKSRSIATPATSSLVPITESDILVPPPGGPALGPLASPQIAFNGQQIGLSLYPTCVGHTAGQACRIEVDAVSFGNDRRLTNMVAGPQPRILYSVDRFAFGIAGLVPPPNVTSEGASFANEAAADVFTPLFLPFGPLPPGATSGQNVGLFDGNGLPSLSGKRYPGLGLVEPPASPPPPPAYDDLDALTVGAPPSGPNAAIYFSLDAAFVDPLTSVPNSDSAGAAGVPPSAVLKKLLAGGGISIYASPSQLGLNPVADDLDALILFDNGDGVYQPSTAPYDWLTGNTDMLLFSVRRGSAITSMLDSQFGIQIAPGDILAPPIVPGQHPRIFFAAENLGLRTTRTHMEMFGDDLDALATEIEPYSDCNHNGVEDAVDIATGASSDTNNNGIPDECEQTYSGYCFCPSPLGPCGNHEPTRGCLNSTGVGGLLSAVGTTSVATDDLELSAIGLPPNSMGLFFMGTVQTQVAFGDGLRCVANPVYRIGVQSISSTGTTIKGPGIIDYACTHLPPAGCIASGDTWNFQLWYRNAASYCTSATYNLTNGVTVTFSP